MSSTGFILLPYGAPAVLASIDAAIVDNLAQYDRRVRGFGPRCL